MKPLIWRVAGLVFAFAVVATFSAASPRPKQTLLLSPGQHLVLPASDLRRVSVANPQIAHATWVKIEGEILITALSPGSTDVITWKNEGEKQEYRLRVADNQTFAHLQEIQTLIESIEGVTLIPTEKHLLLTGTAFRKTDLNQLVQITTHFPEVKNFVNLGEGVPTILAEKINHYLATLGFAHVRASPVADRVLLSGQAANPGEKENILNAVRVLDPQVQDLITIGNDHHPLIRIDLTIMEINRSMIKALGIRWQESVQALGKFQTGTAGANFGLTSSLTATLDLLEKKGWGKILTRPILLCRSGEKATFLAGGEIPIRLISEHTADITFRPYGILLEMAPQYHPPSSLSLQVTTEISSVDGGNSVEGIPAFLTRKIATAVTLGSGETLVLGGLKDQNQLRGIQSIPGLGKIPFLGELFRSRNSRISKTELIVFIQPQVLLAASAGDDETIRRFEDRFRTPLTLDDIP